MTIYCEGTLSGFDEFILQKITEGLDVVVRPIGGTHGAKEAIETAELLKPSTAYLFFRDRDFDVAVSTKPSLTRIENTIYSYRTTVENYLFKRNFNLYASKFHHIKASDYICTFLHILIGHIK